MQPQRSRGLSGEFEDVFFGSRHILGLEFGLELLPFGGQAFDFDAGEAGFAIGAFNVDRQRAGETGGSLREEGGGIGRLGLDGNAPVAAIGDANGSGGCGGGSIKLEADVQEFVQGIIGVENQRRSANGSPEPGLGVGPV